MIRVILIFSHALLWSQPRMSKTFFQVLPVAIKEISGKYYNINKQKSYIYHIQENLMPAVFWDWLCAVKWRHSASWWFSCFIFFCLLQSLHQQRCQEMDTSLKRVASIIWLFCTHTLLEGELPCRASCKPDITKHGWYRIHLAEVWCENSLVWWLCNPGLGAGSVFLNPGDVWDRQ